MAARDAARALGDTARADSYARILRGFEGTPPPPFEPEEPVPGFGPRWAETEDPEEPIAIPEGFTELDPEGLIEAERPRVTLDDVGGLEEVKARLDAAFLAPLRNPELRAYYGKSLRGGLLMYGPPGCGKTFLARAVAGELGANFFSLGLNDVLDMWLGESERRLHDAFQAARRAAPCVLFLDELDALGQKRSNLRHSAGRNVVNQLLAELDGAQADNDGVFVLGATNHPWDIDTALRRPGRLDRTLLVLPPDLPAREAILRKALQERPIEGVDLGQARPPHRRLLGRGPRPRRRDRLRAGAAGIGPYGHHAPDHHAPARAGRAGDRAVDARRGSRSPTTTRCTPTKPVSTTTCWPTSGPTNSCDPRSGARARSRAAGPAPPAGGDRAPRAARRPSRRTSPSCTP